MKLETKWSILKEHRAATKIQRKFKSWIKIKKYEQWMKRR